MTQRFFYTDPLAAAWMAKYFGMRFVRKDGSNLNLSHSSWERKGGDGMISFIAVPEKSDSIHPDSLPLLEPQIDDQGVDADGNRCRYLDDYEPRGAWFIDGVPVTSFDRAAMPVSIDRRNGVAFMWPESEGA